MLHLKYSKYKMENEILFLILRKNNLTQIQQLCLHEMGEMVYLHEMGQQIKSLLLIKTLFQ